MDIDRFTDRNEGDSTNIYSALCEEQGLVDGWTFNDPRVRTRREPSMSTPATLPLDMPPEKTNDAYIADIAIRMLQSRDRSRPFFQVCAFNGPHPPFMIPEPYFSMYDAGDVAEPPNFGPQPDEPEANRTSFYRQLFLDHGSSFDAWRKSYAVYWGFTTLIDDQTGRVLEILETEGVLDDTVVLYISDHGENLGAHGLWHKMVAYEESVRVPMVFRFPGAIARGLRSNAPASLIDVPPTLAGLCGVPARPEWEGVDLGRALSGDDAGAAGRALFCLHKPLVPWMQAVDWRMVEQNRVKYVWNLGDRDELLDLATDPFETRNLIDEPSYGETLARLSTLLDKFMVTTEDPLLSEWLQRAA